MSDDHGSAATTDNQEEAAMGRFDEKSLRADIVSVWGEYGAHVDVFDFMLATIDSLRIERTEAWHALDEAMETLRPLASQIDVTPVLRAMQVLR